MNFKIRLTGEQQEKLFKYLYDDNSIEAVAFAVCGKFQNSSTYIFCAREIITIPTDQYLIRTNSAVKWKTEFLIPHLQKLSITKGTLVKFHSHPSGYLDFSTIDEKSDIELSSSIAGWLDDELAYASVIALPNRELKGRVRINGHFQTVSTIVAAGDAISVFADISNMIIHDEVDVRTIQTFGEGTVRILRKLSVAIVGCSGTGSIVVEQLARLGVGRMILVDPDIAKRINIPRILNSFQRHVNSKSKKVNLLKEAIDEMQLGTEVIALPLSIIDLEAMRIVAESDIIFGCTDSLESRNILNRIATYYTIPYFDMGIRIDADGHGGVSQISGAVHYLQPGKTSLMDRGVYTTEELQSEAMMRTNPDQYALLRKEGYVRGVKVDRPAVISVNMLTSALAVNEFLARIHNFREDENSNYAVWRFSLTQGRFINEPEPELMPSLSKYIGVGDNVPYLGLPAIISRN